MSISPLPPRPPHFKSASAAAITTLAILTILFLFPAPSQAQRTSGVPRGPAASAPSAGELLRKARSHRMEGRFSGRLRTSTSRHKVVIPFVLTMGGGTMVYEFMQGPPEALILHFGEKGSRLERATGKGKAKVVSGAQLDAPVRGTDITYEDLAMKFLYWNRARVIREDTVMTRSCWVVEAFSSGRDDSQYDRVLVWLEKSGALMKAECYSGGKRVARFEVRKVQRAPEGGYVLKSMTISRLDASGRDRTPTYLELTPVASR